jgi:hypothetical protein
VDGKGAGEPCLQAAKKVGDFRKEKKTNLAKSLEALVNCAKAATKLQIVNIGKSSWQEVQDAVSILSVDKYKVTSPIKIAFASKCCRDYSLANEWEQWCRTLSLHLDDSVLDDEKFFGAPYFGHLLPGRTDPNLEDFWVSWLSSVLSDGMVNAICDDGNGSQHVEKAACMFLDMIVKQAPELPEYALSAISPACKLMRGLLALLVRSPDFCGSTFKDVNYIMPTTSSKETDGDLFDDFGEAGKNVQRKLRASPYWKAILKEYREHMGGLSRFGTEVKDPCWASFALGPYISTAVSLCSDIAVKQLRCFANVVRLRNNSVLGSTFVWSAMSHRFARDFCNPHHTMKA